ncbi:MAG: hypothetical protein ACR2IH_12425 [Pyrinomonadaceae bacterium]
MALIDETLEILVRQDPVFARIWNGLTDEPSGCHGAETRNVGDKIVNDGNFSLLAEGLKQHPNN